MKSRLSCAIQGSWLKPESNHEFRHRLAIPMKRTILEHMAAPTTALAVANFLLTCAKEEGKTITHLKLQKLIYFCFAWYAGNYEKPLFDEDIEAWQFGPVIRQVYLEFVDCGSGPITQFATDLDVANGKARLITPEVQGDDLKKDLKQVWDRYKDKSAAWLVDASHTAKEPWGIVVEAAGKADKRQIPFKLIRDIYKARVDGIAA